MWLWENRPHVSELSGKPLLHPNNSKFIWQFLHVLPKGSYPKYKFNPENILLALPEEHEKQNEFQVFNDKYDELRQEYYRTYYGKEFD